MWKKADYPIRDSVGTEVLCYSPPPLSLPPRPTPTPFCLLDFWFTGCCLDLCSLLMLAWKEASKIKPNHTVSLLVNCSLKIQLNLFGSIIIFSFFQLFFWCPAWFGAADLCQLHFLTVLWCIYWQTKRVFRWSSFLWTMLLRLEYLCLLTIRKSCPILLELAFVYIWFTPRLITWDPDLYHERAPWLHRPLKLACLSSVLRSLLMFPLWKAGIQYGLTVGGLHLE